VLSQPLIPWLQVNEGFVDLTHTAELCVYIAALTAAPPGTYCRVVNLSLRYLRPCTVDNETVIARGRILHAGSSFTTVESLIEDALGRAVAHATGSVVMTLLDPPPPPLTHALESVVEPTYPTPDPWQRPLPPDVPSALDGVSLNRRQASEDGFVDSRSLTPLFGLLGAQVLEVAEGYARVSFPASEWFCRIYREVAPGILGCAMSLAGGLGIMTLADPAERLVVVNQTINFLEPVVPDGRPITAVGTVRGTPGGVLIDDVEATDADGRTVLVGQATGLFSPRRDESSQRITDRLLLSVLFTDLVGSTERASELGDSEWQKVLAEHDILVRRQLELHKGREIKNTGDGFLATFDSPTRAVRCAHAISDGVERLGLRVRAGVHIGECDLVGGDVRGVTVHAASRIESLAAPGEVLVSSTVRDLVAGSGIVFADRGTHTLKGVPDEWRLYAVES
jgi:class 3 adenylate cyclase